MDKKRAEDILRNACTAVNEGRSAPQPYGKIVAASYVNNGVATVPEDTDRMLELIAWLLAGAHAADPL
jgi:hypothetical protein